MMAAARQNAGLVMERGEDLDGVREFVIDFGLDDEDGANTTVAAAAADSPPRTPPAAAAAAAALAADEDSPPTPNVTDVLNILEDNSYLNNSSLIGGVQPVRENPVLETAAPAADAIAPAPAPAAPAPAPAPAPAAAAAAAADADAIVPASDDAAAAAASAAVSTQEMAEIESALALEYGSIEAYRRSVLEILIRDVSECAMTRYVCVCV